MDQAIGQENKQRGKMAEPFLEQGITIGITRKYYVEKMIGGGGFGQIYRALDMNSKVVVAVKVEPKSSESGRLVMELDILVQLSNCYHTPRVFYSGEIFNFNYIVMQMLGKNLSELRKHQRSRVMSPNTTARIGVQCVEGLKAVHGLGYIHRDVKPTNICVGIGDHKRVLFVVDFGMARKIRNADGTFRPERHYASFRGTTRYVSITAHERKEQGFVDDIWSLFYSLLELVEGIPWRNTIDADEVCLAKKAMLRNYETKRMEKDFETFPGYLAQLKRTDIPDYDKMITILKESTIGYDDMIEFEWDEDTYDSYG